MADRSVEQFLLFGSVGWGGEVMRVKAFRNWYGDRMTQECPVAPLGGRVQGEPGAKRRYGEKCIANLQDRQKPRLSRLATPSCWWSRLPASACSPRIRVAPLCID